MNPWGARGVSHPGLCFEGVVHCIAQPRAGDWRLRGRLRSAQAGQPASPVEVLLSGVRTVGAAQLSGSARPGSASQPLPLRLHELRVQAFPCADGELQAQAGGHAGALATPAGRCAYRLQLEAREGRLGMQVDALHWHRDAANAFYGALPKVTLPALTRFGWAALLTLLRVPLVARRLSRPTQSNEHR